MDVRVLRLDSPPPVYQDSTPGTSEDWDQYLVDLGDVQQPTPTGRLRGIPATQAGLAYRWELQQGRAWHCPLCPTRPLFVGNAKDLHGRKRFGDRICMHNQHLHPEVSIPPDRAQAVRSSMSGGATIIVVDIYAFANNSFARSRMLHDLLACQARLKEPHVLLGDFGCTEREPPIPCR